MAQLFLSTELAAGVSVSSQPPPRDPPIVSISISISIRPAAALSPCWQFSKCSGENYGVAKDEPNRNAEGRNHGGWGEARSLSLAQGLILEPHDERHSIRLSR